MDDVSRLVDTLVVMNHSKIAFSGSPQEIFVHSAELESMGLAAPQASMLMHRLREAGIDVPLKVFTVNDAVAEINRIIRVC